MPGKVAHMTFDMPYKTFLKEDEIPKAWYNLKADLKRIPGVDGPNPLLNPETGEPLTPEDLNAVFCDELAAQELNDQDVWIDIPWDVRTFYHMYRPSPLVRAYFLEKALDTPAKIFYKYEGGNTSGSHKLNSAIAQAYYAKQQGLKGVATETGAGQWGTALSMACAYFDLDCRVYMVRVSMEQKPYRPVVMQTYGAEVIPSPSNTTAAGRKMLEDDPDCPGSLGSAISEAVEFVSENREYRYVLGSVLDQVLLHQTIIGQEARKGFEKLGMEPDILIACAGGGSNLGGLFAPFLKTRIDRLEKGETDNQRFIAVEPVSCPSLTEGEYRYDLCDVAGLTPRAKMYTLGHTFIPPAGHAGGLRFHGMSPLVSQLYDLGLIDEAVAVEQKEIFEAATLFANTEGQLPAPESAHAIRVAIDEALKCKETGEEKTILFGLTGSGNFDLTAYDAFQKGLL